MSESKPKFFATPPEFNEWLGKHHGTEAELWVGYYKKATGLPSITWPESVDEALCYGWIDGLRKSIDDKSYMIRFTPRRPESVWSAVNIGRIAVLKKEGRMQPAGLSAYAKRTTGKSKIYSYENKNIPLDPAYEREIKANNAAWTYFEKLPPSAKKNTIYWVMSAKKEETQLRRLGIVIECSAEGRRIPPLVVSKKG